MGPAGTAAGAGSVIRDQVCVCYECKTNGQGAMQAHVCLCIRHEHLPLAFVAGWAQWSTSSDLPASEQCLLTSIEGCAGSSLATRSSCR